MSYHDETDRYTCDGPGCDVSTSRLEGWLSVTHRRYTTDAVASSFEYCSSECKMRARGVGDAMEQAAYKADAGDATLSEAVQHVLDEVLVIDRDWDPTGSRSVAMARLTSQAWHVLAGQIERKYGVEPSAIDQALALGDMDGAGHVLDDAAMQELMEVMTQVMMTQGARVSEGDGIPEAVVEAVAQMMPPLRRLAMKRGATLTRVVYELTGPFRLAAAFQVAFADAVDRATLDLLQGAKEG